MALHPLTLVVGPPLDQFHDLGRIAVKHDRIGCEGRPRQRGEENRFVFSSGKSMNCLGFRPADLFGLRVAADAEQFPQGRR